MFYYQKEFVKQKVSGEIAFDVISLFHVQIQEPKRRSATTGAFVFIIIYLFIYTLFKVDLNITLQ